MANDILNDHTKIQDMLLIYYSLKITKLIIIILNFSYLFGMFWLILVKLVEDYSGCQPHDLNCDEVFNARTFIVYYNLETKSDADMIAILTYFAFTSLSTVGFGDYAPRSDLERATGAFMLLCGVAIFSIIMGQFIDILTSFNEFSEENNDGDNLTKFFGVINHFNKDFPLIESLKD